MATEETTTSSAEGGQASTSGLPQAGTTTTDGQAPMSQATPTEHERIIAELRKENAASRKKLSAYEESERATAAAKKAADEAQLSEIERVKKQHAEAEQKIQQYKQRLITSQVKLAAQSKGIIDPDLAALAIQNELEYDDDGMPNNVEKALETLIKNKPYLAPKTAEVPAEKTPEPATPAQTVQQRQQPSIPAMNPGRSSIAQPNTLPPGRIPTLADVYKRP